MLVSLIAAMDRSGLIGDGAGLPWHLPRDLQRFKACTLGKPVIMGRKTFESIGRPLPGRFNIVLSRDPEYTAPGCRITRTLQEALALAADPPPGVGKDEAMIIGGGRVYEEAIYLWDRLYLTIVDGQFKGTTYFPLRELLRQSWRPARAPETHPPDERNRYGHSFFVIERIRDAERSSPEGEPHYSTEAGTDPQAKLEGMDLATVLARGTVHS